MKTINKQRLQEIEETLKKYAPDCGDNSCRFAVEKGGMRTNGGCRCLLNRSLVTNTNKVEVYAAVIAPILLEVLNSLKKIEVIND